MNILIIFLVASYIIIYYTNIKTVISYKLSSIPIIILTINCFMDYIGSDIYSKLYKPDKVIAFMLLLLVIYTVYLKTRMNYYITNTYRWDILDILEDILFTEDQSFQLVEESIDQSILLTSYEDNNIIILNKVNESTYIMDTNNLSKSHATYILDQLKVHIKNTDKVIRSAKDYIYLSIFSSIMIIICVLQVI